MKTNLIKTIAFACLGLLAVSPSLAQAQESRTTVSYLIGFPTGDTNDFIDETSFLGVDFDFAMQILNPQNEASLVIGYQRFEDDLSNSSYTDPARGLTITSDQERSLSVLPLLLKWRYYLPVNNNMAKWFAGAAAGASYVERRFFAGSFNLSDYGWQFVLRPEGGARFAVMSNGEVEASLRYDYGFEANDLPELGFITLGLGFSFYF